VAFVFHTTQQNKTSMQQQSWWRVNGQQQQQRHYTPMTQEEEDAEKDRVSKLSDFKKEQELRKLNREIIRLNMLRGINTGELYTIRGKYKMLLNEYGIPSESTKKAGRQALRRFVLWSQFLFEFIILSVPVLTCQ